MTISYATPPVGTKCRDSRCTFPAKYIVPKINWGRQKNGEIEDVPVCGNHCRSIERDNATWTKHYEFNARRKEAEAAESLAVNLAGMLADAVRRELGLCITFSTDGAGSLTLSAADAQTMLRSLES